LPEISLEALRSLDPKVNREAWHEAWRYLRPAAMQLAQRVLSGPQWEAQREDLVATAISQVATGLIEGSSESFNQLASFGDLVGMTLTILRRRVHDFYRQQGRSRVDAVEELPEPAAEPFDGSPLSPGELREQIEALDPPKPKLFLARFFDGLTTREVAAHFNMPHGTVLTHFAQGLRLLRDRLG
jgi:RNA polymerase sigma factor (sigma-70 family)